MTRFVTTKRASGIGLIAITQEPESSPSWLTSNSAYKLTFPIGGEGFNHVKQLLNLKDEEANYMKSLPKYGTGIMTYRGFKNPFCVTIPSDLQIDPITLLEVDEEMKPYIEKCHSKFKEQTLSAKSVEREPIDVPGRMKENLVHFDAMRILVALGKDPHKYFSQIKEELNLRGREPVDLLEAEGLITVQSFKHSGGGRIKADYLVLTEHGNRSLRIAGINPAHYQHALYELHIERWCEKQGFNNVQREYWEPHKGRIDVYAVDPDGKKFAFEVERSLVPEDFMSNVYKALNLFRVDRLIIVVEPEDMEHAQKIVSDRISSQHYLEMIEYRSINDFL
jgi:hypothetical protein